MQFQAPLFQKESKKDGSRFLVFAPDFPLTINLRDVFFLIFPDGDRPSIVMKSVYNNDRRTKEDEDIKDLDE